MKKFIILVVLFISTMMVVQALDPQTQYNFIGDEQLSVIGFGDTQDSIMFSIIKAVDDITLMLWFIMLMFFMMITTPGAVEDIRLVKKVEDEEEVAQFGL